MYIPYSRKIWRGIKFGGLADRPTYRQIKNPPIFTLHLAGPDRPRVRRSRIIMGVVYRGSARSVWARARSNSPFSAVFSSWRAVKEVKVLLLLTMSLYRFFAKAGMPSRVPSLSDKEIENANASVTKFQEKVTSQSPRRPRHYNDYTPEERASIAPIYR